ncbi:MAG: hypothetical protein LBS99_06105 [Clostridiales bacterium]|jgi:hypothetical protein|nr:hypothetical protein [Clostridiales bacterium]
MSGNDTETNLRELNVRELQESAAPAKTKTSLFRRFVNYASGKRGLKTPELTDGVISDPELKEISKGVTTTEAVMDFLNSIENQLGNIDEQNKLLLSHIDTIKENNRALLEQVHILKINNEHLYELFQASRKREKVSKIIAIISSTLAIGFTLYKIISTIILGNPF